ncbi:MAG: hypothetical protein J6K81_01330 [Rikenellaceae bacterium]|nr:hypothetical protein [Rikenellaceae bacterium]
MKTFFKTTILAVLLTCVSLGASAQIKTSYFMEGSTFRYDMNPALTPQRGYLKLPGLSMVGVDLSNTLLSLDRFLYNKNGETVTFMHSSVTTEEFLKKLNKDNSLGFDVNVPLFGVADYGKRCFWSFDWNVRVMGGVNVPRDLFKLLKSFGSDVNLGNLRVDANAYSQAALGFAFPIGKHVTFGFKVKGLWGLAHATVNFDDIGLSMNKDVANLTAHGYVDANIPGIVFNGIGKKGDKFNVDLGIGGDKDEKSTRESASAGSGEEGGNSIDLKKLYTTTFNDIPGTIKNVKNGGVAFDLGVKVSLLKDHLRLSASVVDLGWIWWNKTNGASVETSKIQMSFDGVNLSDMINGKELDVNQVLTHNLNELTVTNRGADGMVSRMATQFNVGVEYAFLRNHISVGLLSHNKFYESHTYSELTASLNFRPGKRFSATFSHSFLNSGLSSMGFAINVHGRGFNLFLGTDYIPFRFGTELKMEDMGFGIPIPTDTFGLSFHGGISFSLHEAHYGMTIKEARKARRAEKNAAKLAKIERNKLK